MKKLVLTLLLGITGTLASPVNAQNMKPLTPEERRVIVEKGTERPFSGAYYDFNEEGLYRCRQCGAPLYRSQDKFDAGWLAQLRRRAAGGGASAARRRRASISGSSIPARA